MGGNLDLKGSKIHNLPENLIVKGNLNLRNTQIATLPKSLTVGGNLDLRGTPITYLPKELTVEGYLDIRDTQIASLPKVSTVGQGAAVGRIEYLGTNGLPGEIVEYTDAEMLIRTIQEDSYYGAPVVVVLYRDANGHTIPQDFLTELDPPPKGFRVEDAPVQLENSELMNLGRTFNIDNPQESIDLATSPEGPDWDY